MQHSVGSLWRHTESPCARSCDAAAKHQVGGDGAAHQVLRWRRSATVTVSTNPPAGARAHTEHSRRDPRTRRLLRPKHADVLHRLQAGQVVVSERHAPVPHRPSSTRPLAPFHDDPASPAPTASLGRRLTSAAGGTSLTPRHNRMCPHRPWPCPNRMRLTPRGRNPVRRSRSGDGPRDHGCRRKPPTPGRRRRRGLRNGVGQRGPQAGQRAPPRGPNKLGLSVRRLAGPRPITRRGAPVVERVGRCTAMARPGQSTSGQGEVVGDGKDASGPAVACCSLRW